MRRNRKTTVGDHRSEEVRGVGGGGTKGSGILELACKRCLMGMKWQERGLNS